MDYCCLFSGFGKFPNTVAFKAFFIVIVMMPFPFLNIFLNIMNNI